MQETQNEIRLMNELKYRDNLVKCVICEKEMVLVTEKETLDVLKKNKKFKNYTFAHTRSAKACLDCGQKILKHGIAIEPMKTEIRIKCSVCEKRSRGFFGNNIKTWEPVKLCLNCIREG